MMKKSPFSSAPARGAPSAGGPTARPPRPSARQLYDRLLADMEGTLPELAGMTARQGFDYAGIPVRFTLDEENEQVRIVAEAGTPPQEQEQRVLHELLEVQLASATPAWWTVGWDRAGAMLFVQSHLRLVEDMPAPMAALLTQVETCSQMARAVQARFAPQAAAPRASSPMAQATAAKPEAARR